MKVIEQLCIKSYEVTDGEDSWKAVQGRRYTTSVPHNEEASSIMVFSNYWVSVPRDHFVPVESSNEK